MLLSQDLQSENRGLKKQIQDLMFHARRNQDIMGRFQELEFSIIGSDSYEQLIQNVLLSQKEQSSLDAGTLILSDPHFEIQRILLELDFKLNEFPDLIFVDDRGGLA